MFTCRTTCTDELNIFTTPDEVIRNEQLQWQEILEQIGIVEDSANKTISADFVPEFLG